MGLTRTTHCTCPPAPTRRRRARRPRAAQAWVVVVCVSRGGCTQSSMQRLCQSMECITWCLHARTHPKQNKHLGAGFGVAVVTASCATSSQKANLPRINAAVFTPDLLASGAYQVWGARRARKRLKRRFYRLPPAAAACSRVPARTAVLRNRPPSADTNPSRTVVQRRQKVHAAGSGGRVRRAARVRRASRRPVRCVPRCLV